jgi:hypothetical protein
MTHTTCDKVYNHKKTEMKDKHVKVMSVLWKDPRLKIYMYPEKTGGRKKVGHSERNGCLIVSENRHMDEKIPASKG